MGARGGKASSLEPSGAPPQEAASGEAHESDHSALRGAKGSRRFSRRRLIIGTGAAAVLAGAGVGISEWVSAAPSPTDTDDFRTRQDLQPFTTSVAVPANGVSSGYVFLTSGSGPGQRGPMIVDNAGELVWFRPAPTEDNGVADLKVQSYRGRPVLTWWEGRVVVPQGYGLGEYVIADTAYREIARIRAARGLQGDLHEFVLTPAGTALFTVYRAEPADLRSIAGPSRAKVLNSMVQEVDLATGRLVFEWNPRDHVDLSESYLSPTTTASNGGEFDFIHLNSIDIDTDGNLIVSARHTWTVYKVDRSTGDIMWRLNGKRSDFELPSNAQFQFQHDAVRAPDGSLTLFDDGGGPPNVATRSRGLALGIDEAGRTVTFLDEYLPDPAMLATSQGSVQTLPNGNRFVGWGSQPSVSEFSHDGRLLFDLSYPDGADSYRAYRFEWTGKPVDRPALNVKTVGAHRISVAASWNGATEVVSWRFLTGRTRRSLEPVATVPRKGFETTADVTATGPLVAVQALDVAKRVLGTSETASI